MTFAGVRDAVAQYVAMGFRVVPLYGFVDGRCSCRSPDCKDRDAGKHEPPETDGQWKEGRVFGPDDFDEHNNVAIALGPWGGSDDWLACLDIDGPLPLDEHLPALPETLEQTSPRGRHLIYTVPSYTGLGNWVDVLETRGTGAQLDLRFARGRIVVAPSRNAYGAYSWLRVCEPAPLPPEALAVIYQRRTDRGLPVAAHWWRGGKLP